MATTAAILEKMRLMISEEGKGPLEPRLLASFCGWCELRFCSVGRRRLGEIPFPTNACPCHLVSYCGANCQASHWAAHSATCEQLRGADAESGEMPVLETGPADLPSIHLAAQVKRLTAEVKLQKEELAVGEHAFHGLMDPLVQSILNLASRNDALESHSIQLAAQIKRLTAEVKLQKEELAARQHAFNGLMDLLVQSILNLASRNDALEPLSIHLAAQVKRLTAEVKLQKEELAARQHAFNGLMDLLVQHTDLATRNDALEPLSIQLAREVKRLTREVERLGEELAAVTRQYAFHGLMDLLVQHTNLATRNDALEFHRDALAEELIQTLSARNNTLWSATERHQIEWSEGPQMTDKDWTAFLEESQEEFKEECAEVSLRLWNEWSAAQLP